MRSLLAILVTFGGLIACNDHGAQALTSIKTKVCACKTASCAELELARVPQQEIASNHRTQTIARDMLDCLAKLQAAERPSTDPDEEGAAGSAAPAPSVAPAPSPPATPPTAATAPRAAPAAPRPPAATKQPAR